MLQSPKSIFKNAVILAGFKQAWQDSNPGIRGGHEEGGFVLQDLAGNLSIVRWPRGAQNSISVLPHSNCKIGEYDIVLHFTPIRIQEVIFYRSQARQISAPSVMIQT